MSYRQCGTYLPEGVCAKAHPGLLASVRRELLAQEETITRSRIAGAIRSSGSVLSASSAWEATEWMYAELGGLGPLQPLLNDTQVTDIHVNAPGEVWCERGHGFERVDLGFENEEQVRALAVRLMGQAGKSLDDSHPCLDACLSNGLRIHAVLPPLSPSGTVLSMRIRRVRPWNWDELVHAGMMSPAGVELLQELVDARLNFLISGATGSGKTTLLSTMLGRCSPEDRVVIVEDTAELDPEHHHVLRLESRRPNLEGRGAVGLDRLVYEALRMNPSRIVVGECRGTEIRELLTALNTGHSGCGTIHANSARDVPARLCALGALAGWDERSVTYQALSALDVIVHIDRLGSERRLGQLAMLGKHEGMLDAQLVAECRRDELTLGPAWGKYRTRVEGRHG